MTTIPTQLLVPGESSIDLKFNAGKIDQFVTSFAQQYIERFGNDHCTDFGPGSSGFSSSGYLKSAAINSISVLGTYKGK